MDQSLHVTIEMCDNITVVKLAGSADAHGAGELERGLTRLIAGRPKWVVFDMLGLTLLTSLAMGQLVALKRSLGHHGGAMHLVTTPLIHSSLKHTRLDALFHCFATVDEAIGACTVGN